MAAEAETGGERTEEPSQKRLQDARDRGQLPRSRELTNFATMIGGSATLLAIGGVLSARLSQMMRRGLAIDRHGRTITLASSRSAPAKAASRMAKS